MADRGGTAARHPATLDLAPGHPADGPRLRADLRALPLTRHSLDAVRAGRSYGQLDPRAVPLAWWDLHRALRVGGRAVLELVVGDAGQWPDDLLGHVLVGAGFAVVDREERGAPGPRRVVLTVRRERTLADTVGPGMRLLLVGLNPSVYAADAGVGFARPGNRAWPALLASGLATVDRDPVHLLAAHRIGMTDLVKRATPRADELDRSEYREGLGRLDALCRWLRPGAVCVVGLTGWRSATGDRRAGAGVQDRTVGGRAVYLMPNPSGLNAHTDVDDLARHLRSAVALGDGQA